MIKTRTLFILGAGASGPFGYPSGIELREKILSGENNLHIAKAINPEYGVNIGLYLKSVKNFIDEFLKSSLLSIDSFLENRPEFMEIGKIAIASYIIRCEEDSRLRNHKNNWYMYLFDRLKTSFEDFDKNNISFVTFNYDRSLEQFLFDALKSSFNEEDEDCSEKLNKIKMVHLYGKLDPLPWQDSSGFPYNSSHSSQYIERIKKAKDNIKLINDERDIENNEAFQAAYSLIENAQKIYFLGFGFDQINLERLKIDLMKNKSIQATALGLASARQRWIKRCFKKKIKMEIYLFEQTDSLSLLQRDLEIE